MKSFLEGRADPELTPKLLSERAGILNLALDALDRLRERGRLLQHTSGEGMAANLTDLASNVKTFVEECCAVGTDREILVDTLFNRFRGWCELKGIKHAIGSNHFDQNRGGGAHRYQQPPTKRQSPTTNDAVWDWIEEGGRVRRLGFETGVVQMVLANFLSYRNR